MKYATLAQGSQVANLIVQKKVSAERLQALLETGLLADLLDIDASEVNRNSLRMALGLPTEDLYEISLRANDTFATLYGRGRWDSDDISIFPEYHHISVGRDDSALIEIVRFGVELTPEQAAERGRRQGLVQPTPEQVLAFGADHHCRFRMAVIFPHEPVDGYVLAIGTNVRNFRYLTKIEAEFVAAPHCQWAFVRPSRL